MKNKQTSYIFVELSIESLHLEFIVIRTDPKVSMGKRHLILVSTHDARVMKSMAKLWISIPNLMELSRIKYTYENYTTTGIQWADMSNLTK